MSYCHCAAPAARCKTDCALPRSVCRSANASLSVSYRTMLAVRTPHTTHHTPHTNTNTHKHTHTIQIMCVHSRIKLNKKGTVPSSMAASRMPYIRSSSSACAVDDGGPEPADDTNDANSESSCDRNRKPLSASDGQTMWTHTAL